jgi:DNA-binding response OmpR family regulator
LYKLLIIDDDTDLTEMLKLLLEPKSFTVMAANSGEEGIATAKRWNPDLIILDLFMPEMDGWQVCKSIRVFSKAPILVLSAMNKPGLITRALDEGADDYLIKPVSSNVLLAHLNNLTRRIPLKQSAVDS